MDVRFSESDKTMNLRFNRESVSTGVGFSENDRTLSTDFKENDVISQEVMFGETDRRMTVGFGEIQTAGGSGIPGAPGKDGLSAYEVAVKNGFRGSEKEWLASLKGDPGEDGLPGRDGLDGITPHVGENGNWFIGENDTGIPATGPAGNQGLPGKDGVDGKNGYTPVKGIDYCDGEPGVPGKDGYTPVKGVDYFDGLPGEPGKDGYTPVKGVDYFDGAPGEKGESGYTPIKGVDYFDGTPGADGQPGKDGYSPVRGKDYWTDADRQQILAELIASGVGGIKSEIVVLSDVTLTKGALLENQIITFPTKHCNADNYICKFLISSWPKQTWADAFVFNVHSDCTYVIGTPGTLFAYNQFGLATMATQKYDLIAQFIYYDK